MGHNNHIIYNDGRDSVMDLVEVVDLLVIVVIMFYLIIVLMMKMMVD